MQGCSSFMYKVGIKMTKVKLFILIGLLSVSFGAGWYIADTLAENEALEKQEKTQKEIDSARERARKAELELANRKPEIREKAKVVTREVFKYVPTDDCELDDEWLRIYGESVDVANSSSSTPSE